MTIGKANLSQNNLPNPWRWLVRGAWYPVSAIVMGILIASIPGYLRMLQEGVPGFDFDGGPLA